MYDRILVPTDGSKTIEPAVEMAVDLAEIHDADIHAVHVLRTDRVGGVPLESGWAGVVDIPEDEGKAALAAVESIIGDRGIPFSGAIVNGRPSIEIVRYARENDCDLIIMATQGRDGINRLILGSVSECVVRRSPVPVLTVRRLSEPVDSSIEQSADANVEG